MRRIDILESALVLACLIAIFALAGCPGPQPMPVPPPAPGPAPPQPGPAPPAPPPIDPRAEVEQELLKYHNAERSRRGLPPLAIDPLLGAAARAHADHMADVGQLAHYGIGDGDPWQRIKAAGYSYAAAGENAAYGQETASMAVEAWMSDAGHRANVLGRDYTDVGFGVASRPGGRRYWTADYASPARGP
jgi:uncharacterized protein YkwD